MREAAEKYMPVCHDATRLMFAGRPFWRRLMVRK